MSYQVLARKWRPKNFSELMGQEHVVRALVNGLDNDRLHHAFLFTGTRGVGKTTIARIFAKALNCKQGVSSEPCGECDICLEVDAASRTKVDDTRELLDNVQYAPTRGRYKVYLIDEVHMLSTHSFNALLKTLEEPPPHVKFLLATTDPQKLPVTVLSRCLQFNLKRMRREQIEDYLRRVLEAEGVESEADAITALALAADGSMRDALSLLDQALAYGAGALVAADVRTMLGTVERDHIEKLARVLADGDADGLWSTIEDLASFGPDFGAILRELAALFHKVVLRQLVPDASFELDHDLIEHLAARMSPTDVQLAYEIVVQGKAGLDLAPDARTGFEMALLRILAFRPLSAADGASGAGNSATTARQAAPARAQPPMQSSGSGAAAPAAFKPASIAPSGVADASDVAPAGDAPDEWGALIKRLGLRGPAAVLASHSALERRGEGHFRLVVAADQAHLRTAGLEQKVREAMCRLFGKEAVVDFVERDEPLAHSPAERERSQQQDRYRQAREAIDRDPVVQDLKSRFDATVIAESVKPLN